jgi:hypothetical protein
MTDSVCDFVSLARTEDASIGASVQSELIYEDEAK